MEHAALALFRVEALEPMSSVAIALYIVYGDFTVIEFMKIFWTPFYQQRRNGVNTYSGSQQSLEEGSWRWVHFR